MRTRALWILALLAVIAFLYAEGFYDSVDAHRLQVWVRGAGAWGGIVFVVAYACLQPLGVRSIFFLLSAPLIWSPLHAALLSWIGATIASVTAFGFARLIARDWAQQRAPARLRRLDERLANDGFRTVMFLRLVFYTTPALQFALGVSRVRLGPFLVGTVVGILPFTVLMSFLGAELYELLAESLQ